MPPSRSLPGKLQAADKKEEQHLAFYSVRGRRETSAPFECKQFLFSLFKIIFFLLSQQNSLSSQTYFFIQNKISIYMILSFLTMYRSAKMSTFIATVFPRPIPLFAFGKVRDECSGLNSLTCHVHLHPASNACKSD